MSREIDLTGIRAIAVDNLGSGAFTVQRGEDDRVHGRLEADDPAFLEDAVVRQVGDQLQVTLPRRWIDAPEVYLDLTAPPGISYRVASGSADVRIAAPAGRTAVNTGSGDVELAEVADVTVKSGSGSITISELTGRAAQLSTASGEVVLERVHTPARVRSASGDVRVRTLTEELQATSSSGDISVAAATASLDLRTASGSLEIGVAENLPAWLDLSSASGSIDIGLDADQAPDDGDPYLVIRARTASGDIVVTRA